MRPVAANPQDEDPPGADPWPADPGPVPPGLCRCAACGYRLDGLPRVGRCPECNAAFDRSEVVLVGRRAGKRTYLWWSSPLGAIAFVLCLMLGAALWAVVTGGRGDPTLPMLFAVVFLLIAPLCLRARPVHGHEVAVRMTPRGIGAVGDPADAAAIPLTRWSRVTRLRLIPKRNDRLWIWVRCDGVDLFDVLVECPRDLVPDLQRVIGRWFQA